MTDMNALDVNDLRFSYADTPVVDVDAFSLATGRSVAVIGPSGCGKTSFLHLLAGLLRPDSGSITVFGQNLASLGDSELDRFRGRSLGLVLQKLHLIRALTVRQNLQLASRLSRQPDNASVLNALLERLDIAAVADHKPSMLSQGQAQRAAIARALIHRPRLVLADEPTSALDDAHAATVIDLLKQLVAETDAALMVVTHDQRIRGALDTDYNFRSPE